MPCLPRSTGERPAASPPAASVISGSLQVLVGEELTVLEAGDFVAVPPHTPHAFAAAPGCEADVLFVFTPGMGRFDYLRLLGRVMRGEADAKEIAAAERCYVDGLGLAVLWRTTEHVPIRAI